MLNMEEEVHYNHLCLLLLVQLDWYEQRLISLCDGSLDGSIYVYFAFETVQFVLL